MYPLILAYALKQILSFLITDDGYAFLRHTLMLSRFHGWLSLVPLTFCLSWNGQPLPGSTRAIASAAGQRRAGQRHYPPLRGRCEVRGAQDQHRMEAMGGLCALCCALMQFLSRRKPLPSNAN